MNDHLVRIKALDEKIKQLERIRKDKIYLGTGILVELSIGDGEQFSVDLGMLSDIEGVVDSIYNATVEARTHRIRWALEEKDQLVEYFDKRVS